MNQISMQKKRLFVLDLVKSYRTCFNAYADISEVFNQQAYLIAKIYA